MAIQKQSLPINFAQGLDTKTDEKQVQPGKFLALANTVFNKGNLLQKRNGYGPLTALPSNDATFLTTFNGNLTAIGNSLLAYSDPSNAWLDKGPTTPVRLSTLPIIRNNTNQSYADIATASNGLICTVYTDNVPVMGVVTEIQKYVIADALTGQNVVAPTEIPIVTGTVTGAPRVFSLGKYFIIVFNNLVAGVNRLSYIAINSAQPDQVTTVATISSQYTPETTSAFDGVVANNTLYLAWNGNDMGGAIRARFLTSTLDLSSTSVVDTAHPATSMSLAADVTVGPTPVIYVSFVDSVAQNGFLVSFSQALVTILPAHTLVTGLEASNITSTAFNGIVNVFYEVNNDYTYDAAIPTHYINHLAVTNNGIIGPTTTLIRSVGLASKAFVLDGMTYFMTAYQSDFQPSYFLINQMGEITAKLAYSNGGGYCLTGLPNAPVSDSSVSIPYLIKDSIQAVNKAQGASNPTGVYSQTGINVADFTLNGPIAASAEIGNNLNIQGGYLLAYDGYSVVENGFFLWPDNVEASGSATGGSMASQQYFYIATYEWSDNQGNMFRSAPSVPVSVDLSGSSPSVVCSASINVPTLRLTYKINNPVKLVLYRWSTAQQIYYQTTSIISPNLNDTSVDYLTITDTNSDADILGNNILYTTGGVVENISPPANDSIALFQSRMFLIDAEDKNLLWFSKQIIESTPVEMSDLLTIFVAPTVSSQGPTGPMKAISAMDDKLIVFKKNALYYITGVGPDNTGANNQFSEPTFITATVGSENQQSIVFTPEGLVFQSDKGMWLLGRDLSTSYIGAPVEAYTQNALVQSAVNVPGTNQVRFTLDSGVTLMYDYYYRQWGTFTNVPAVSSTLYQGLHTYLSSYGAVFQETPGAYLDNANPVLISFTTSWFNLAGLQGYERAYFFYLLGTYISPHKLSIGIAYDYNPSPTQVSVITPTNCNKAWGGKAQWGSSPSWGGSPSLEQWRVFLKQQKCQAFQITLTESFDPTMGQQAGAGLTLSGIDIVIGAKSGYPRLKASNSVG